MGATSLTALLELILFRSLATPDSAWETITYGTTSSDAGAKPSMQRAVTWIARPMKSVIFKPRRDASQPPTRFVTMPAIS